MEGERPDGVVKDVFLAGAAARAESYEIAAYGGLVTLATVLGEREAATLLEANLAQERAALQRMEIFSRRLTQGNSKQSEASLARLRSESVVVKRNCRSASGRRVLGELRRVAADLVPAGLVCDLEVKARFEFKVAHQSCGHKVLLAEVVI
jgi:Domain of unknown function (DUF892)